MWSLFRSRHSCRQAFSPLTAVWVQLVRQTSVLQTRVLVGSGVGSRVGSGRVGSGVPVGDGLGDGVQGGLGVRGNRGGMSVSGVSGDRGRHGVDIGLCRDLHIDVRLGGDLDIDVGLSRDLLVDIRLSGDLHIDVGLGGDLLVHVGLSGNLDVDVLLGRDFHMNVRLSSRVEVGIGHGRVVVSSVHASNRSCCVAERLGSEPGGETGVSRGSQRQPGVSREARGVASSQAGGENNLSPGSGHAGKNSDLKFGGLFTST